MIPGGNRKNPVQPKLALVYSLASAIAPTLYMKTLNKPRSRLKRYTIFKSTSLVRDIVATLYMKSLKSTETRISGPVYQNQGQSYKTFFFSLLSMKYFHS